MNEVVAELDGRDLEDSEDDFDGYLDTKSDDEAYTNKRRDGAVEETKRTEKEDVLIATNIEIESYCLLSSPLALLPSTPFSLAVQLL